MMSLQEGMTGPRVGFARNMARMLLGRYNISSPPIPVRQIAILEGLIVIEIDCDECISGIYYTVQKLISVNMRHPVARRRFSIAHELGHHILNHPGEIYYDFGELTRKPEKILDVEANEFASELLIPLSMIKRDWTKTKDPKILARRYRVSESALWVCLIKKHLLP